MKRVDMVPYMGEADMLECRLTELDGVIDKFVIVEADVTHGKNEPKPYLFLDQRERFDAWLDRIVYIQATDLPTVEDAWSRELAQREWFWKGLGLLDLSPTDIVMQSDVDEIPTRFAAGNVRPKGMVVFHQRFHPFAVDWLHPAKWQGTVAARFRDLPSSMSEMRAARMKSIPAIPDAGWHFSWVSDGLDAKVRKLRWFCHPEIAPTWEGRLPDCYETGIHVDGAALQPVEVEDGEWPIWITEGNAPASWFRPRDVERERPVVNVPQIVAPG